VTRGARADDRSGLPACVLAVRVQPGASRTGIQRLEDGRFRVSVTARAVEGAANRALIEYLAELLQCPRSSIVIVAGERSRDKILSIAGFQKGQAEAVLSRHAGPQP